MGAPWQFKKAGLLLLGWACGTAWAAVTPPDLTVCSGAAACEAPESTCRAGFNLALTSYSPAATSTSGSATYTYEVCSPPAGTCSGNSARSCLDDDQCARRGEGTCNRLCSTTTFRDLSHFDVTFPELGLSCLGTNTEVTGSCTAVDNTPTNGNTASVGSFTLGDGSCGSPTSPFAKCDGTSLEPGDCLRMTVTLSGELNGLGLGAGIVLTKEATECSSACIEGPSCDPCFDPPGDACLTRTIGFWGTHPWITNNYAPVTVCGYTVGCNGADDGKSSPSCGYGSCTDVMEALGTIPSALPNNPPYVAMVRQLAAAKLNLAASAATAPGPTCADFSYGGKSIQQVISECEGLCGATRTVITNSGCIEALDAFNNSQDIGYAVTPAPFDRPSVDDHGQVSGADPRAFTAAQKNNIVVGRNQCKQ